jgi:flagellar M-ring protein FliF
VGSPLKSLQNQLQPLRDVWNRMQPVKRASIALVVVAVFAALVFVVVRNGNPQFVPLYAGLEERDAAEVVSALRDAGISYRLAENGTTVLVPQSNLYQVRLDLASKGLPRSGIVGFEIFQQFSFGSTDFERNIKYTWALQGEITRTIRQLNEVDDARVHIALPEKSLFLRETQAPTASVLLRLKPGARLSAAQVNGIAYLVAHSVESMSPESVTIVDTEGNVLSQTATGQASVTNVVLDHLEIQGAFERSLEQRLVSMLEPLYGKGKALVRVKSDMTFDNEEETLEIYEQPVPEGLLRSSSTQEEISGTGGSTSATIVDGNGDTVSNTTSRNIVENVQYTRRSAEVSYELNRTERHRIVAPGRVLGLSVAVWIDGDLSPSETEKVRSTVLAAISGSSQRGDVVTVESMPFHAQTEQEPLFVDVHQPEVDRSLTSYGYIGAGVLLLLLLLGTMLLLRRRPAPYLDVRLPEVGVSVEEGVLLPAQPPDDDGRRYKEIERLAKEQPAEFAKLLRGWLDEEES